MKREQNHFTIALVLLVILLGGYYGVKEYIAEQAAKEEEEAQEAQVTVTDFAAEDVIKVSYTYEDSTVTFEYQEDGWIYPKDTTKEIDASLVETLIENYTNIVTEDPITGEKALDEYGLETPAGTISFTFSDETELICNVGDYNSVLGEYYFMTEGNPDIYLVSGSLVSPLSKDVEDYVVEEEEETEEEESVDSEVSTEIETEESVDSEVSTENETEEVSDGEPLEETEITEE